jgi:hypothetical protein
MSPRSHSIFPSSPKSSASAIIHSVHFYDRDEALIQRLRGIVSSAVSTGNSVLIVATEQHREQLASELQKTGLNPAGLEKDRRLKLADASEMLARFMVNGMPDRKRFTANVSELISSSREGAWNAQRGVTVFGEMVALLWQAGNHEAALELEVLWNDLLQDQAFHLHCAYPRHILEGNHRGGMIRAICQEHSHVMGGSA